MIAPSPIFGIRSNFTFSHKKNKTATDKTTEMCTVRVAMPTRTAEKKQSAGPRNIATNPIKTEGVSRLPLLPEENKTWRLMV